MSGINLHRLESVAIVGTGGNELAIDGSGQIAISNASFAVTATDLDIRDIASSQDSIEIKTAAGQALAIDASGFLTSNINGVVSIDDNGGSLTVDNADLSTIAGAVDGTEMQVDIVSSATLTVQSTDLDIRDLAFASDSVTAHQGGSWSFTADNMSSWKTTAETATNTASELVPTPLASRAKLIIQNLGSQDVYIGPDNAVTTANGMLLPKDSSLDYPFDATANVFAITGSGSSDIRVLEAAA